MAPWEAEVKQVEPRLAPASQLSSSARAAPRRRPAAHAAAPASRPLAVPTRASGSTATLGWVAAWGVLAEEQGCAVAPAPGPLSWRDVSADPAHSMSRIGSLEGSPAGSPDAFTSNTLGLLEQLLELTMGHG